MDHMGIDIMDKIAAMAGVCLKCTEPCSIKGNADRWTYRKCDAMQDAANDLKGDIAARVREIITDNL